MKIPKQFCIAGGKKINVKVVDNIDDYSTYGNFSAVFSTIKLARKVKCDGKTVIVNREDLERTFLHELIHCMNYFYNCETDENIAQTFSNFVYEYLKTKN